MKSLRCEPFLYEWHYELRMILIASQKGVGAGNGERAGAWGRRMGTHADPSCQTAAAKHCSKDAVWDYELELATNANC